MIQARVSKEMLAFLYEKIGPELMCRVSGVPDLITDDRFLSEVAMYDSSVQARLQETATLVSIPSVHKSWDQVRAWFGRPDYEDLHGLSPAQAVLQGHNLAAMKSALTFLVEA